MNRKKKRRSTRSGRYNHNILLLLKGLYLDRDIVKYARKLVRSLSYPVRSGIGSSSLNVNCRWVVLKKLSLGNFFPLYIR